MSGAATFAGRWAEAVAAGRDRPFLAFEAPSGAVTAWTYGEFDDVVARAAGALASMGVRKGAAVHVALTNCPTFVAAWLAAARLGAWIVPSDPGSTAPELAGHITRTCPVVGLCGAARADAYTEAAAGRAAVIEVDEAGPVVALAGAPVAGDVVAPRDRLAVMFTSGTTSAPKGVEVTQANYAFAGDVMAAAAALRADDRQLVVLPLFHANAQYYSFASAISAGASVALVHAFSASRFLEQAARHGATCASLFAAPMRMILARGAAPVEGLRLRHVWYAQNVTGEQYDTLAGLFGCRPRQLYGMTETIPAVLSNRALAPVPDSMGVPTLGCEVALRAADGGPVPDGETGEVVVRGEPGVTVFAGYLDDPVTTEASFIDGWFRTGDLAHRNGGRYFFDGRRSDVLKVAGENVSVVEVEAVLSEHPSVLEAAVVGEPDPIRDEVPVGFVVLQPGAAAVSTGELLQWCESRLAKAKRPVRIDIVDELPRTSVGKIRKFLLKR
ncbi:MAG TPA: AMP-binding protein [Acidimicrobiales bacterium]|nr:AMP-binding protein [Acidimicrobiales bacterium]